MVNRAILHPEEVSLGAELPNVPVCVLGTGETATIEQVAAAPGRSFDHGLFRLIREPADEHERALRGPTQIDDPRTTRTQDPHGPGAPIRLPE